MARQLRGRLHVAGPADAGAALPDPAGLPVGRARPRGELSLRRCLLAASALLGGCGCLFDWIGGDFAGPPSALHENISPEARRLLEDACRGIDPDRFVDLHVHIAGLGTGDSGTWIHPSNLSILNPWGWGRTRVMMSAAGVEDEERADEQYVERLLDLLEHTPMKGRAFIYAMEAFHGADGKADLEQTGFTVPNARVVALAEAHPDRLVPVVSIHPYRPDALDELTRWADRGVRFVKWIPSALGIDPSDARVDPFYRAMIERRMVLLSHTGQESAVDTGGRQGLDNPLRLRRPLELGLNVVALHCASDGTDEDLDDPARRRVAGFDLFLRLMDDPRFAGRLYGEISASTFVGSTGRPLATLLERTDLHPRLIHGSDYPVCAINAVIRPGALFGRGYLTRAQWHALNEIYAYHPLLFDFAVKRTIRHPVTGSRFADSVFMLPDGLERHP